MRRSRTYVWSTPNVDASTLIEMTETSADGRTNWQTRYGPSSSVTSQNSTVYNGIYRTNTAKAENGSLVVTLYTNGVRTSVTLYDSTPNNPQQIGATTFTYDAHGRVATATDARNGTTTYGYNNADQVMASTTPPPASGLSGLTTQTAYDSSLRQTNVVYPDAANVASFYTPDGQLQRTFGSRIYPVQYSYDTQGRVKTMTTWTNFGSGAGAAVTSWNYDQYRGWLTSKVYPDTHGPSYGYTAAGRLQSRNWARGTNTTYAYNAAGDLATVSYNDGTTPSVSKTYDRLGRLSTVTDNGITTTMAYDSANDLLGESYSGGVLDGLAVANIYDGLLRRTNKAVWNGSALLAQTTNNYDTASRLLTVSYGTNTATYSYLANSPLVDHITFAHSGTTEMTTRYTNDYVNRLTGISSALNFAYQYNLAGQRVCVTNGDGSYWVYQYDALGQVTNGVKHWGNGTVVAGQQFGYGFDTIGNRTMTLAGGDQNGANRRQAGYAANNLNQYTSRTVAGAADVIGMATNTATVWVNQMAAYRSNSYFWLGMPVTNTSGPVYQTVTTLAALPNGSSAEYGVTNIGHVFVPRTPESFGYDLDGNLTNDGHWSYYWDGENRLVAMTNNAGIAVAGEYALAFAYDYQGRRIQKLVCTNSGSAYVPEYTNRFLYDGWNAVAILNPNASIAAALMWGTDLSGSTQGAGGVGGLLAENLAGNGVQFIGYDGNGNVAALVSATSGAITANYEYGPFLEVIRETGPMAGINPYGGSTKFWDRETGFLYYGFRYYNPSTGRWPSRDPIEERGGLNLYASCRNDLLGRVDGLGQTDVKACVELLASIYVQSKKLIDELKAYDPVADGKGGPTWKPGGHYQEIQDLQQGLKNRLAEFVEKCLKRGGGKPFPRWADQMANIKVPAPVYNYTGPLQLVQFQIPQMPALEEATAAYTAYAAAERNAQIAKAAGKTALVAGGCYVVYRGIRMIPSLFPPLWWTIPENLAIP